MQPLAPDPIPGDQGWDMCRVTIDDPYLRAQDYGCNMIPKLGRNVLMRDEETCTSSAGFIREVLIESVSDKVFYLGPRPAMPVSTFARICARVKQSAIGSIHPPVGSRDPLELCRLTTLEPWSRVTIDRRTECFQPDAIRMSFVQIGAERRQRPTSSRLIHTKAFDHGSFPPYILQSGAWKTAVHCGSRSK